MTFDPVNKPSHYVEGRQFEPIAVIEDWGLGYHLGCALKYISRAGRKSDNAAQDISKAIWYLERYKEKLAEEEREDVGFQRRDWNLPTIDPAVPFEMDQEEIEWLAMGELGTVDFGPDELPPKDLSKFKDDEIVETWEQSGQILGRQKNGDVRILKHHPSVYEELLRNASDA